MSLLDTASLLLTPNAYKEGKLYSVIPSDGSGDFTFTRATTATRVNSDGLVELVPYNLIRYTEDFSNAAWGVSNRITVASNTTTAPNGTLTADSLIENTASGSHYTGQSITTIATQYNFSVYAKSNGRNRIAITEAGGIVVCIFNISNGTIVSGGGNIENVGNGWYRCSATYTASYTSVTINLVDDSNNLSYTGNGTSGVYLWGAQLVEGTNALPYQKTETRLNIPRLDYSLGGCPNILLEPQRTNTLIYSDQFDNAAWIKQNGTITPNTIDSPSGVSSADTFTDNSTNGGHLIARFTQWSTTTQTFTIYVKPNTLTKFFIANGSTGNSVCFDLTTLTVEGYVNGSGNLMVNPTITPMINGWIRLSATHTATASQTLSFGFYKVFNATSLGAMITYIGSGETAYLWGAQLEAGSYATSYIPTTTASVTRNQDVLNLNDLQNKNILSSDWTIYSEFIDYGNSNNSGVFILGLKNSTGTDRIGLFRPFTGALTLSKRENNGSVSTTASLIQVTNGNIIKASIKCTSNNLKVYINGSLAYTSAFANPSLMTDFELARIGATFNTTLVKSALAFNVALTDEQCIALTTI